MGTGDTDLQARIRTGMVMLKLVQCLPKGNARQSTIVFISLQFKFYSKLLEFYFALADA